MPKFHYLKILPEYFEEVIKRNKTFEIRKNDRRFETGDIVLLQEYDGEKYTGRTQSAIIGFLTNYYQKQDFVVFSIILFPETDDFDD